MKMNTNLETQNRLRLSTYTPRVRHLSSLNIRNISYKWPDINNTTLYFTLHKDPNSEEFYKSESLSGTVNLSWTSLDFTYIPTSYTSSSHVCVRVWVVEGHSHPKVHLEYNLELRLLQLLEDTEKSVNLPVTQVEHGDDIIEKALGDVLTLKMFDSLFAFPEESYTRVPREYLYLRTNQPIKLSYSFNLLARLQMLLRALKQTEQSVEKVREEIMKRLAEIQPITEKKEQIELHKLKLEGIRHRLDQRRQILLQKKSRLYSKKAETNKKEKELDVYQKSLQGDDIRFTDVKSDFYNSREKLLKERALLAKRHKQMVYELSLIYPIEQTADGRYTIAGVCLPDPEHVTSQNELACSTALGHCCHLVIMLSQFLQVSLEYPLEYRGSRSLIYDNLKPLTPSQKDRSYPLYSRGKDRKMFLHAVFLLNRNIETIRFTCDLQTKYPRHTLRNIKDLLQTKFSIGSVPQNFRESRSPPVPIQRISSDPSLLRRKSLPAISRQQSMFLANWDGLNSPPSADMSSDESPANGVRKLGNLSRGVTRMNGSTGDMSVSSGELRTNAILNNALTSKGDVHSQSRDEVDGVQSQSTGELNVQLQSTGDIDVIQSQFTDEVDEIQSQITDEVDIVRSQATGDVDVIQSQSTDEVNDIHSQSTNGVELDSGDSRLSHRQESREESLHSKTDSKTSEDS